MPIATAYGCVTDAETGEIIYPGKAWAFTKVGGIYSNYFENGCYFLDVVSTTGVSGSNTYLVRFTAPNYYPSEMKEVNMYANELTRVDVQLKPLPPFEHEPRKNVLEFAKAAPDGLKEEILLRLEYYESQKEQTQQSQTRPTAPPAPPTDRTDAARRLK